MSDIGIGFVWKYCTQTGRIGCVDWPAMNSLRRPSMCSVVKELRRRQGRSKEEPNPSVRVRLKCFGCFGSCLSEIHAATGAARDRKVAPGDDRPGGLSHIISSRPLLIFFAIPRRTAAAP